MERTGALTPQQVVILTMLLVAAIGLLMVVSLRVEEPRVRTSRAFEAIQEAVQDAQKVSRNTQESTRWAPLPADALDS